MQTFLNLVIGGAVAGGLYAILASGVVLTYRTSGIFNFAHGAVAFATAFFFVELNRGAGLPLALSAVLAVVVFAPLLGLAMDRVMFRHLGQASETVRMVVPIALLIAVPGACLFVVDRLNAWFNLGLPTISDLLVVPGLGPTPPHEWRVGQIVFDSNELIILASVVVVVGVLWIVLRHTRLGLHMRAVVDRRTLASLRGVNADLTSSVSWMMGAFLAGLAGVLLAPVFGLDPSTFTTVVLVSTFAVVLARFVSLPLAVAGGLLIGVVQNLVTGYATFAQSITGFSTSVPYILLLLVLIAWGIGRRRRAAAETETTVGSALSTRWSERRTIGTWAILSAALLVYVFLVASNFWAGIVAQGLAVALVMLSFTVVTGLGGMVSFAQPAFVTAAGFTAGWILSHNVPFAVALLAGTAVATVLGVVVSLPSRRLGGLSLALATLALAFIAQDLLFQLPAVSNEANGGWTISPPKFGPVNLNDPHTMVVCLVAILAVAAWVVHNLIRSASGRAMAALRGSEVGAVTSGVAEASTKMKIFAISAALAGFGGVLLAMTVGQISNTDYPVEIGLFWLATVVVMGVRYPGAAVIAGLTSALLPELLVHVSTVAYLPELLSGVAVLTLVRNQEGVWGLAKQRHAEHRARRAETSTRSAGALVVSTLDATVAPTPATAVPAVSAVAAASESSAPRRLGTPSSPAVTTDPAASVQARARQSRSEAPKRNELLVLDGIRAGYSDVEVLKGVDLVIEAGESVAVVGANGAGKSTLCSVVAGLVKPTDGMIRLKGRPIEDVAAHRRVAGGVLVIPEGRGIFPSLSVEENLRVWTRTPSELEDAFGSFPILAQRRSQLAGLLSGGEQQMLALAPALARSPGLLIADEPSLGLAPMMVRQVYASLAELRRRGVSILLVEEKARDILSFADRVAFMAAGRIVWDRRAPEVSEELLISSYLGLSSGPAGSPPVPGDGASQASQTV